MIPTDRAVEDAIPTNSSSNSKVLVCTRNLSIYQGETKSTNFTKIRWSHDFRKEIARTGFSFFFLLLVVVVVLSDREAYGVVSLCTVLDGSTTPLPLSITLFSILYPLYSSRPCMERQCVLFVFCMPCLPPRCLGANERKKIRGLALLGGLARLAL